MRVWLGWIAAVMGVWCAWAQPLRLTPIAYDAAHDAYYVADELVVGLEPNAPTALVAEVMRWVSLSHESIAPLEARVLRLEHGMDAEGVRELLPRCRACAMWSATTLSFRATTRCLPSSGG